jgi:hypothetical protein
MGSIRGGSVASEGEGGEVYWEGVLLVRERRHCEGLRNWRYEDWQFMRRNARIVGWRRDILLLLLLL